MRRVNFEQGTAYYTVDKGERQFFNHKLEELYRSYGKYIEMIPDPEAPRDMAYMEHNHTDNEFYLKCGKFWFEEDNLLPIIAMTHELGHYVDLTENFNQDAVAYGRTLGTLEMEVRAWEHAIAFCKRIGLDAYENVIYEYAKACLSTYFHAWFLLERFGFDGEPPTYEEADRRIRAALAA